MAKDFTKRIVLRPANIEPQMQVESSPVSDSVVVSVKQPDANLDPKLIETGDSVVLGREPDKPVLSPELSDTSDSVVLGREPDKPVLSPELSDTSDVVVWGTETVKPTLPLGLPDVEDSLSVGTPIVSPPLPPKLLDVGDSVILGREPDKPVLSPELSDTSDSVVLGRDIERPSLPPELLEVSDILRQRIKEEISLSPELPQTADDSQDLRKEYSFVGAWVPDGSPINIGAKNYETLKNFRYKDDGIEGVDGFTRVQTNIVASGKQLKGGIQLKTNYTQASYILAQGEDSDPSGLNKVIYQNKAIVPAVTDFTSLHAYADTTAAAIRSRFSMLPGGQVGICGGGKNLIWAGEEMEVAGFFASTNASGVITTNSADLRDYTERVKNTLTDANNSVLIEGWYYGYNYYFILTTRPIQGIKLDLTTDVDGDSFIYLTGHNVLKFKYDGGASTTVTLSTVVNGNSYTVAEMASYLNAGLDSAFGGSWTVTFSSSTGKFTITAPIGGHTVQYINSGSNGNEYFGFNADSSVAESIISNYAPCLIDMTYWDGDSFASTAAWTDNTQSNGISLAQDGTITWDASGMTPIPVFVGGYYLYCYMIRAYNRKSTIHKITVDAPIQTVKDIWDGILRTCLLFHVYRVNASDLYDYPRYNEFTLEVAEKSYSANPLGACIGGLFYSATPSLQDYIIVIFSERQAAFYFELMAHKRNKVTANMSISYYGRTAALTGVDWRATTNIIDQTKSLDLPNASLSQSGFATWDGVNESYEVKYTYNGITGYAYKLTWSATLSINDGNDTRDRKEVIIDTFNGVPAYRTIDKAYGFPWMYRNRAMWCDCISDSERSRIDYSPKYSTDVYNGEDSSGRDNARSLYFGSKDKLTGAVELFKEFSDGTDSVGVVTKTSETYLLSGDNPETFQIRTISHSIGCPAPLTIGAAEMAIGSPGAVKQNVAIWMSDKGPVVFNGNIIQSLVDFNIKKYFTPGNTLCIKDTLINIAAGIYDPNFNEYHLVIPSGTSATINNVWLVYDLGRNKWRENVPTYDFPQAFIRVEDTLGNKYIYTVNDNGFMVRLDNGRVWSTTTYPITHTVKTGAGLYSDSLWNETMVNRLKVVFDTNTEGYLEVNHYLNGNSTRTTTVGDNTTGLPPSTAPRPMRYGGVEVITNGTFETTTGWTDVGSTATLSSAADGVHGNCLKILNTGSAAAVVRQTITVVADQLYRFTCFNKNGTGAKGKYRIGTTPGGVELKALTTFGTTTVWTINTFTFTATATTIYLDFVSDTTTINDFFYVDDVSIRAATSADDSVYSFRNLIMQCAKTVSSVYYGIIGLSHAFEFIITACSVTKPKLLGWGVQYSIPREDIVDKDG